VAGRDLILATSNGTRTLRLVGPGRAVAIAALLNRRAVADWLAAHGDDAFVVCSGYEGAFSLEDAVCAGGIAERAAERGVELGDGARACRLLWQHYAAELPALLQSTGWGRHILALGLGPDLELCARLDTTEVVPVLRAGEIRAENVMRKT
jgi:2-phosphosulfolactate phosphatase